MQILMLRVMLSAGILIELYLGASICRTRLHAERTHPTVPEEPGDGSCKNIKLSGYIAERTRALYCRMNAKQWQAFLVRGKLRIQQFAFRDPMVHGSGGRLQLLEKDLHNALANDEFVLVYQPQIDVRTWQIVGTEVLLRWDHPELGRISPEIFIPMLEESGMISPVGEWVLRSACEQMKKWEKHLTSAIRISVNLSVKQLLKDDIPGILSRILRETGLDPRMLELEITESIFLEHTESMISTLQQIRETGVSIAIDDFGTGQSSLSYFKYFPIQTLKIDRIFIGEIASNHYDRAIVFSLILLAHSLQMKVIAEGVEHMREFDILSGYQCDEVQGFLFSRPLTARDFEDLMASEGIYVCNTAGLRPTPAQHSKDWSR